MIVVDSILFTREREQTRRYLISTRRGWGRRVIVSKLRYGNINETHHGLVFRVRKVELQGREVSGDLDSRKIDGTGYDGILDLKVDIDALEKMQRIVVIRGESIATGLEFVS